MGEMNGNKQPDQETIVTGSVESFISEFLRCMYEETGFSKIAFTEAGLQGYLKCIAKKCFQLNIYEDLLLALIQIAKAFSQSTDDGKKVENFVMILYNIVYFFGKYYLGRGLLMITASLSCGMTAFLLGFYHVVTIVLYIWGKPYFLKLKDWIMVFWKSEIVRDFFEQVFPTYGKTLMN